MARDLMHQQINVWRADIWLVIGSKSVDRYRSRVYPDKLLANRHQTNHQTIDESILGRALIESSRLEIRLR